MSDSPWIETFEYWLQHERFYYPPNLTLDKLTSKNLRSLFLPERPKSSNIEYHLWRSFWFVGLPPTARNVWFRLIYNLFPSLLDLYRFKSASHTSPACTHCTALSADNIHILITYPKVYPIWEYVLANYLSAITTGRADEDQSILKRAILDLRLPFDYEFDRAGTSSPHSPSIELILGTVL